MLTHKIYLGFLNMGFDISRFSNFVFWAKRSILNFKYYVPALSFLFGAGILWKLDQIMTATTERQRMISLLRDRRIAPALFQGPIIAPTIQEIMQANAHFQGLHNIHRRDRLTRHAILLLCHHQREIPPEDLYRAVQEFRAYLNQQSDSEQKNLALLALEPLPYVNAGPYPALLGEQGVWSINGLAMTGEEMIGRLWIFTGNLQGNEIEITRKGMIAALADAAEGRERVCNPGKMQRLCQAALQGYLPGVNLDVPGPITPEQALMNFTLAHQDSDSAADLIAAAHVWLRENPLVQDKAGFMNELRVVLNM